MDRRYFWTIPECVKYRLVFEDTETVLGVNGEGEHRLFRKDTGKIFFNAHEALSSFVADFLEKEFAPESEEICV